jgi:hypothetical protein
MRLIVPVLFILFALTIGYAQQEQQPTKQVDPDMYTKVWKKIPTGWSKLKLSDAQRTKIYDTKRSYFLKTFPLQQQLDDLKSQELQDCVKHLTDDQKKKLVMIPG